MDTQHQPEQDHSQVHPQSQANSSDERQQLPRALGDGLTLRYATPADAERLGQFNGRIFGHDRFDEMAAAWTRDFVSKSHPTSGPSHVSLVEDNHTGQVASSMCLIPQTWTYAGISFGVGRPEAVATDPAYRRRGLVRVQMNLHHADSERLGHLAQAITGIPWYYRQFGYEYALDLGGGRLIHLDAIPALKEGQAEAYSLRLMTMNDLPFVKPLYERACAGWLVACPRPDWLWQHMLTGNSPNSVEARHLCIIETAEGRPVGYLNPERDIWKDFFTLNEVLVIEGQSLRAIMPSILRYLKEMAQAEAAAQNKPIHWLRFSLGRDHPLYQASPDLLAKAEPAYGWYMRVSDLPRFLRHIAPVLETRLAASPMAGHSGEFKISEYTSGFKLTFTQGRLSAAEAWQSQQTIESDDQGIADAAFPPLVFLQLLFGFRSLAELRATYPDCWATEEAHVLLNSLFPSQVSHVLPVG